MKLLHSLKRKIVSRRDIPRPRFAWNARLGCYILIMPTIDRYASPREYIDTLDLLDDHVRLFNLYNASNAGARMRREQLRTPFYSLGYHLEHERISPKWPNG